MNDFVFSKNTVKARAAEIVTALEKEFPEFHIEKDVSKSGFGESLYVVISYSVEHARRCIPHVEIRISDHEVGDRRHQHYNLMINPNDVSYLATFFKKLATIKKRVDASVVLPAYESADIAACLFDIKDRKNGAANPWRASAYIWNGVRKILIHFTAANESGLVDAGRAAFLKQPQHPTPGASA